MSLPTIAAISTPPGISGISIIRVSGENSISIVDKIFKAKSGKKLCETLSHRICYGHIIDRGTQEIVDEVLVTVMRAPYTYTREDVVEINSHGGYIPSRKILELLIKEGAVLAQPGEFTKRAFLSGRICLTQAEAVADIIYSKTESQAKLARLQLEGKLSSKIKEIKNALIDILSNLEVVFDYPEEDIILDEKKIEENLKEVLSKLEKLLATYSYGKILKEGVSVTIVGKPNVGKSTLYNLLLGQDKVIVTDIPGTTRDIIEGEVYIGDVFLSLKDTAGIRRAKNKIEKIGIEKTKKEIDMSDVVLFLIDTSRRLSAEDIEIANLIKEKDTIIVFNKIDLPERISKKRVLKMIENTFLNFRTVETSLLRGEVEKIREEIKDLLKLKEFSPKEIIISSLRHKILLEEAVECVKRALFSLEAGYPADMLSIDIRESINAVGKITGETSTEDILNNIFEKFCVGK